MESEKIEDIAKKIALSFGLDEDIYTEQHVFMKKETEAQEDTIIRTYDLFIAKEYVGSFCTIFNKDSELESLGYIGLSLDEKNKPNKTMFPKMFFLESDVYLKNFEKELQKTWPSLKIKGLDNISGLVRIDGHFDTMFYGVPGENIVSGSPAWFPYRTMPYISKAFAENKK